MYDYGRTKNRYKYGRETPPLVDLRKVPDARVPIAMFAATSDELADPKDSHWTRDTIEEGENLADEDEILVHYQEIKGGDLTFLIGHDMSYFEDVIHLVRSFNPLSEEMELYDETYIDPYLEDVFEEFNSTASVTWNNPFKWK